MAVGLAIIVTLGVGGILVARAMSGGGPGDRPVPGVASPAEPQRRLPDPALAAGASGTAACTGLAIHPGADIQAALTAGRHGATFCFAKGVYRLSKPLVPRQRQKLIGWPGAVLLGARKVTGWTRSGRVWTAPAPLPREPELHGSCAGDGTLCQNPHTVLLAGRPLRRAASVDTLSPGSFVTDHAAGLVALGEDPGHRRVEVALTESAVTGKASGVRVQGFVVEGFANPAQQGAIDSHGPDWVVKSNEVRFNHGVGIMMHSGHATVTGNHVHHNGQLGIGADSGGGLYAGNEIDANNTAGFDPEWEAGGAKWTQTTRLVVRDNLVHDNNGPGLWTDINCVATVYEGNVVRDNRDFGIFHEISYDAVIRGNEVTGNGRSAPEVGWGGAGIRIAASRDVQVIGNVLSGNANGIMLIQQDRSGDEATKGPHELDDVIVEGNDVAMARGATGLMQDVGDRSYFGGRRSIRFTGNTYRLARGNGVYWAWSDELLRRDQWMRTGHDRDGRYLLAAS